MTILRIRQIKSTIGSRQLHRDVIRTLGLKRIGDVVERPDSPSVRGLIDRVKHLVSVEEVNAA